MNKSAPLLPAARLFGGVLLCLLAWPATGLAQQPESTPANVDAASVESKPDAGTTPANDTEILASQGATFAAKERIAVFNGDVRVKDVRFVVACDKLTVFLAKAALPGAASTPPPMETTAKVGDDKSGDFPRGGGIERAIAEGHVIIIQKHAPTKPGEEEKVSVGRADIAEFDNKTGDMILRGLPKVEQNGNSHEALSRSTWMVLHRDNSLETHGPSRTLITPHGKDNLPGSSPGAKASATPPPGSPASRHP